MIHDAQFLEQFIESQWMLSKQEALNANSISIVVLPLAEIRILVKLNHEFHFFALNEIHYIFVQRSQALLFIGNVLFSFKPLSPLVKSSFVQLLNALEISFCLHQGHYFSAKFLAQIQ